MKVAEALDAPTGSGTCGVEENRRVNSPATAFAGRIEPTKLSLKYKVGLTAVVAMMVLLCAVYGGIILAAAYWVYYHLAHHAWMLEGRDGSVLKLGMYLWPALAGATLIFFMVKPFFAGRPEEPPKYSLTRESDPMLFELITRICEQVNAPLPSRVDVDCQVNASASFNHGLRSLRGNDVVLTIGLPLAAGLTTREFAGVLAHEFGHFAQGAGMRSTYIIRVLNAWFARVVYERDRWDVMLVKAAFSLNIRLGLFLHLVRLTIWLVRRVLWVLMHIGRGVSCFMLRQMEFDADSYETKLAGSDAFARTTAKVRGLAEATPGAYETLRKSWEYGRLPADFPRYLALALGRAPAASTKTARPAKTRLFDTHPCDEDRMRAAAALNQRGIFHLDAPATNLFKDFGELSRAATRFHYEHELQLRFSEYNLVSHESLAQETQSQEESDRGLRIFFGGLKWDYLPIPLETAQPPENEPGATTISDGLKQLTEARRAMGLSQPGAQRALAEYGQAEQLLQRGVQALRQDSQQATQKAEAVFARVLPALGKYQRQAAARLAAALELLRDPRRSGELGEALRFQEEATSLTLLLNRLGRVHGMLRDLRRKADALQTAAVAQHQPALAQAAARRIAELTPELQTMLDQVRAVIEGVRYPFFDPREDLTLDGYVRNAIPASSRAEALFNDCGCLADRLLPLYTRALGRLAFIAVQVEIRLGIPAA